MAKCTVSDNQAGKLGEYDFPNVPRVGEKIAIQDTPDTPHKNYVVSNVSYRAAGPQFSAETFVFVDKEL